MWVFAPSSSFSTESSVSFSLTLKTGSRALLGFSTFSPFQLFSSSRLSTRTFSSIFKNSLSCRLWTSWTSSLPSMPRFSCTSEIQKTLRIHFLSDEMQQNMFLNLWNVLKSGSEYYSHSDRYLNGQFPKQSKKRWIYLEKLCNNQGSGWYGIN